MNYNLEVIQTFSHPTHDPEVVVAYYNNPFFISNMDEYKLAIQAHEHAQRCWLMAVNDYHQCPNQYHEDMMMTKTRRRTLVASYIQEWEANN